ncbi:hypothetical protein H4R33_004061 [Dimargaris cristalligena]|uniref:Zn(2)-C6 fungal-type domain-containing protein n=1 Tax=Dimargaris cristalligena TaxID=215637 RepID=A0A4P9ZQJ0_9FUNG|nr:hypothetical protein H4R33_004061 [Dimargaris cristalligena]RKP35565.1 hypothetical protein BJ085DRAFT_40929 [Dimargaris cristalligena]|eukprot:RKP35565.1 hypothetical protein BJ085DRAFT_40929 [Dimargaris cristalligena]
MSSSSLLLRRACDHCSKRKVKCDGRSPCTNCVQRKCPCVYSNSTRRAPAPGLSPATPGPSLSVISEFKRSKAKTPATLAIVRPTRPGPSGPSSTLTSPTGPIVVHRSTQAPTVASMAAVVPSSGFRPPAQPSPSTATSTAAAAAAGGLPPHQWHTRSSSSVVQDIVQVMRAKWASGDVDPLFKFYSRVYGQLGMPSVVNIAESEQNAAPVESTLAFTAEFERGEREPLTDVDLPHRMAGLTAVLDRPDVITPLVTHYYQQFAPASTPYHALRCLYAIQNGHLPDILVNALLAYMGRRSQHPSLTANPPYDISRLYFNQAHALIIDALDQPSLYTLLAYQLLEASSFAIMAFDMAIASNDLSIRLCLSLNLHRIDIGYSERDRGAFLESTIAHTVYYQRYHFWSTVYLHFHHCMVYFTLPIISLNECAVLLPDGRPCPPPSSYRKSDHVPANTANTPLVSVSNPATQAQSLPSEVASSQSPTDNSSIREPAGDILHISHSHPTQISTLQSFYLKDCTVITKDPAHPLNFFIPNHVGHIFDHPHHYAFISLVERVARLGARKTRHEGIPRSELDAIDRDLVDWYAHMQLISPLLDPTDSGPARGGEPLGSGPPVADEPFCRPNSPLRHQYPLSALLDLHCLYHSVRGNHFLYGPAPDLHGIFDSTTTLAYANRVRWSIAEYFSAHLLPHLKGLHPSIQTRHQGDAVFNMAMVYVLAFMDDRDPVAKARCVEILPTYVGWMRNHGFYNGNIRTTSLMLRDRFGLSTERIAELDQILQASPPD